MCNLIELLTNRRIDSRMPVAVHITPQATHAIDKRSAMNIDQSATFRALDQQRLVLGHLREGMPDVLAIPAKQVVDRRRTHVRLHGS